MLFELQFPKTEVEQWAERYIKNLKAVERELEGHIENVLVPRVQKQGFLTKEDFRTLCRWKARGRTEVLCEQNEEEFIRVVTSTAFSTTNERFRIVALGALKGVDWTTASVLLHFGHKDPYPLLDTNSLWAVGIHIEDIKKYDFELWGAYVSYCRKLAEECNVSMRNLDRALWRFGKEKPRPKKKNQ